MRSFERRRIFAHDLVRQRAHPFAHVARERGVALFVRAREQFGPRFELASHVDVVTNAALVRSVVAVRSLRLGPDLEARVQDRVSALSHLHADGVERGEEHRRIDGFEIDVPDMVAQRVRRAPHPEDATLVGREVVLGLAARPATPVVSVESGSTKVHRESGGRIRQIALGDLDPERDGGIGAERSDLAEVDVLREADHPAAVGLAEKEKREPHPGKEHEEAGGEPEDRDRQQAGGDEKAAVDDATASQNARNVDRQAGPIACSLPVVALHLAAQVAQHERTGRYDDEAEKTEPVAKSTTDDRPGDEVQKGKDDDLLIVRGPAPRCEPDDLEGGGELDRELEDAGAGEESAELDDQERDRSNRRKSPHPGSSLGALGDGQRRAEPGDRPRPRSTARARRW